MITTTPRCARCLFGVPTELPSLSIQVVIANCTYNFRLQLTVSPIRAGTSSGPSLEASP